MSTYMVTLPDRRTFYFPANTDAHALRLMRTSRYDELFRQTPLGWARVRRG